MARIDNLGNFLTDVADAIRTKKGTTDPIVIADFDTEIENLPSGVDPDDYFITSIVTNRTSTNNPIYIPKKYPEVIIGPNVTRVSYVLGGYVTPGNTVVPTLVGGENVTSYYCLYGRDGWVTATDDGVQSIDVSQLNTSKNTNCYEMFANRYNLMTITGIENMDTHLVTNMASMFRSCHQIQTLDLSGFDTSSVTSFSDMFNNCMSLTHIDMRNFTFGSSASVNNMFGSSIQGVPDNCEIIVKDDTTKTFLQGQFSRLTNIKTVAEYEAEQ